MAAADDDAERLRIHDVAQRAINSSRPPVRSLDSIRTKLDDRKQLLLYLEFLKLPLSCEERWQVTLRLSELQLQLARQKFTRGKLHHNAHISVFHNTIEVLGSIESYLDSAHRLPLSAALSLRRLYRQYVALWLETAGSGPLRDVRIPGVLPLPHDQLVSRVRSALLVPLWPSDITADETSWREMVVPFLRLENALFKVDPTGNLAATIVSDHHVVTHLAFCWAVFCSPTAPAQDRPRDAVRLAIAAVTSLLLSLPRLNVESQAALNAVANANIATVLALQNDGGSPFLRSSAQLLQERMRSSAPAEPIALPHRAPPDATLAQTLEELRGRYHSGPLELPTSMAMHVVGAYPLLAHVSHRENLRHIGEIALILADMLFLSFRWSEAATTTSKAIAAAVLAHDEDLRSRSIRHYMTHLRTWKGAATQEMQYLGARYPAAAGLGKPPTFEFADSKIRCLLEEAATRPTPLALQEARDLAALCRTPGLAPDTALAGRRLALSLLEGNGARYPASGVRRALLRNSNNGTAPDWTAVQKCIQDSALHLEAALPVVSAGRLASWIEEVVGLLSALPTEAVEPLDLLQWLQHLKKTRLRSSQTLRTDSNAEPEDADNVSPSEFQEALRERLLNEHATVIEYWTTPSHKYATTYPEFTVCAVVAWVHPRTRKLRAKTFRETVTLQGIAELPSLSTPRLPSALGQLRKAVLMDQILRFLDASGARPERLYVAPYDHLAACPFHALPGFATPNPRLFLCQTAEVVYIPKASSLTSPQIAPPNAAWRAWITPDPATRDGADMVAALFSPEQLHPWQKVHPEEVLALLPAASTCFFSHGRLGAGGSARWDRIELAAGSRLAIKDIEDSPIDLRGAEILLAACHSGRSLRARGDEMRNLVGAFLAHGASTVMSWLSAPTALAAARVVSCYFHARITKSDPAAAINQTWRSLMADDPWKTWHTWAPVTLYSLAPP